MLHVIKKRFYKGFRIVHLQPYAKHWLYNRYVFAYFALSLLRWKIIPISNFKRLYRNYTNIKENIYN